ncbi:uncharacterized protein [Nicotiana sylvestris]|uniref:uncharacterized protein n=1 Tax=Nicotiana sylvestris TaxID=4096 RepID=UPI00388C4A8E
MELLPSVVIGGVAAAAFVSDGGCFLTYNMKPDLEKNVKLRIGKAIDEALQKLIAQQVNKALEAFVSQLPVAPPTPTPNNNTLENPRSGFANSGSGGTPTESREGEPGSSPPKPPSPKRTVNVISGGEDINGVMYTAANKVSKITITHGKQVRHVLEEESITFDDADVDGVLSPHNDALVISLLVHDTNVKRVLIDPGSSVNIILLRVLCEMQAEDKLIPKAHTLFGFDNSSVVTKGEVILTTFTEGVVKDTKFQVVDMEMAYNMILGRPWIHEMDAVPSTLHQVIKFPSPWEICQISGDQQTSRSINSVADSSTRNEEK